MRRAAVRRAGGGEEMWRPILVDGVGFNKYVELFESP
jgi:hypothetical protein